MIQFPLKISVFRLPNRLWRATTPPLEWEVIGEGQTKEHALGSLFYAIKDMPGLHLWTFDINFQEDEDDDVSVDEVTPPLSTAYELELYQKCGKIEAIKAYRSRTKCGLRDSKEAIERDAFNNTLKRAKLTNFD